MDIATLKRLNEKSHPRFFGPFGNKEILECHGITNVVELDSWQSFEMTQDLKVSLTPAEHFSNRQIFDKNKTFWGSYMITYDDQHLYFGGDTAYASHFKVIRDRFGPPDIAFLPIGAYDPR